MIPRLRVPALLIWLTVLWLGLWGRVSVGNVLAGLLVAAGVLVVARPTGVTGLERSYFHPVAVVHYVVSFLRDLVWANLVVAWEILTPTSRINRAIISVPMHTRSEGVVALVANSITLTPGTVTIDVERCEPGDPEHTVADGDPDAVSYVLYVHVLHLRDVEEVRRDILRLERLAIKAFGDRGELAAVDATIAAVRPDEQQGGPT